MQDYPEKTRSKPEITKVLVAGCLILVLFLSIFESMGIDGIVPAIQQHYSIKDAETAVIMTSSSITHTATLGLVWIFGDSFKRRRLLLASISMWIVAALLSIFLGSETFLIFVILRALASAAAAIFGVLIPVVLADLFKDRALGVALMCMSVTEMVAILLTGVVSSRIVTSDIPWQSGLVAAPALAFLPLIALFCLKTNIRNVETAEVQGLRRMFASAFGIFSIKSYLLMIAISSLGMLHMKAYSFWFPSVYLIAWTNVPEIFFGLSYTGITMVNSVAMMIGTGIGLPTVLWLAQSWRHGTGPFSGKKGYVRAYPIVVSAGATFNVGMFILSILMMDKSYIASLCVTLFVGLSNSAGGSLSQQMLLMVVPPASRAAAVALSRLISGLVSTPSAQIVGMVSDAIRGDSTLPYDKFHAYQLGMLSSSVFLIAGALCNIAVIFFFASDCKRAEEKELYEKEEVDERSLLNGKGRSESILESFVRSRTVTVNSFY